MNLGNVLLIDDSDIDNMVNKRVLEKSTFADSITVKNSAMGALQYIEELLNTGQNLPDHIFLDIRMPDIDGFGFLDRYNAFPEDAKNKIKIIMLSSSIDEEDYRKSTENPYVIKFLNKPLTLRAIELLKNPQ